MFDDGEGVLEFFDALLKFVPALDRYDDRRGFAVISHYQRVVAEVGQLIPDVIA